MSPPVCEGLSHSKEVAAGLSHVQEETVESLVADRALLEDGVAEKAGRRDPAAHVKRGQLLLDCSRMLRAGFSPL